MIIEAESKAARKLTGAQERNGACAGCAPLAARDVHSSGALDQFRLLSSMTKGLDRYEERMAAEVRKIRSMKRIESSLAKRRNKGNEDAKERALSAKVVKAAAMQPSIFSSDGLQPASVRSTAVALRKLTKAKRDEGGRERHCFLAADVCDRTALIVAPKRDSVSVSEAVHVLEAIDTTFDDLGQEMILLRLDGPFTLPLFGSKSDSHTRATTRGNTLITIVRADVDGVPIFALRGASDATQALFSEPVDLGLSARDFGRIQRAAARLLGLRLSNEWAVF